MIGKTIHHYMILEKLGKGGMGEVYLAEDTELDRKVALKFLPLHYTTDPEINARFKREAKAAAALNHPNIITVYEVGEHNGKAFIAMEHVEGQSLKEMLSKEELSVDKAIEIGSQICEGLKKAHQAGITHRDIKPDNILLDSEARVKIADFGLAMVEGVTRLTRESSTLGTLNYMSPEQIQSAAVDQRSDIFSVGVVLYEMITGELPFKGEYEAAVVYSIAHEDPEPLSQYKNNVPEKLQRVVDKALDKKPDTRYQNIADLLTDLKDDKSSSELKPIRRVTKRKLKRSHLQSVAVIALLAVIVTVGVYLFKREPTKHIPPTHTQLTFVGDASWPAISPDGQFIAYVTGVNQKVWLQDFAGGQPLEIFSGSKDHSDLRWSPDGSELLIRGDGDMESILVPRLGGSSHRIKPVAAFPCWSPDASQIASSFHNWKKIVFTNRTTGDTSFISLAGDFDWLNYLDWSPDGHCLLFYTSYGEKEYTIWTIKTDGTQQQKVVQDSLAMVSPRWSTNGDAIYYFRSHDQTKELLKVEVASASGKADKSPQLLQTGLQAGEYFTLSKDNKRLLYTRESNHSNLWLVRLESAGNSQNVQTTKLTTGTSLIDWPAISPDGKRIAFSIGTPSRRANMFVIPIEGGQMQQLTFFNSYNSGACWSPDGKEIAFGSNQGGKAKIWRVNSNGGMPRPFANSELSEDAFDLSWYPRSDICYLRPGNTNCHILNPYTEEERRLVASDSLGWIATPRFAPDGKNVMLYWNRMDRPQDYGIWLISLEDSTQTLLHKGYFFPIQWSNDAKWIYAYSPLEKPVKILKIPINGGKPETLVTLPFESIVDFGITMTYDGKHIVCAVRETQSDVWVMENFDPEVQ